MKKKLLIYVANLIIFSIASFAISEVKYDFGDLKSATLSGKAWNEFNAKNWDNVTIVTDKCIDLYTKKAIEQQKSLTQLPLKETAFDYWALNDVATCHYIKALAFKQLGQDEQVKEQCNKIISDYSFAQCWDSQGWFWSIANASKDVLSGLGMNLDFGDYTSEYLTKKVWESLSDNNLSECIIYAEKCITLYAADAKKQQDSLQNYASKENAFDYWALNDVATCYYLMGEAYSKTEEWQKALKSYVKIIEEYQFAQCWDTKGWFWKIAVACRGKINKIKAEQNLM